MQTNILRERERVIRIQFGDTIYYYDDDDENKLQNMITI